MTAAGQGPTAAAACWKTLLTSARYGPTSPVVRRKAPLIAIRAVYRGCRSR